MAGPGQRPARGAGVRRRRRRGRAVARVLLVGSASFIGGLLSAPFDFSVPPPPTSALLLSADGRQISSIAPPVIKEIVKAEDIPQIMRDAIISAEDERFLEHSGVDPLATFRAIFRDLTGGVQQGGSTLTQQYVKNAYVGTDRTAMRKVREAALAIRLERQLSKDEILTDYLNALYLGNGLYGVQAASNYYFGVPVKDLALDRKTGRREDSLALARASLLAGIAPAPSAWNPTKDFTTARGRQQYTLNRMVVNSLVSPQQASEAYQIDVKPVKQARPAAPSLAPEFTDYVTARLREHYSANEDEFFRGGVRVKTTLDLDLQTAFAQALKEVLPDAGDPQAAIVAVDYRNGDVKAMSTLRRVPERVDRTGKVVRKAVTGYQQKLGFNLATNAQRSSGSTIKPFTLAQALMSGMTLTDTRYGPARDSISCAGCTPNPYVYGNSDPSEAGTYTLRRALAQSVNTIYLPLANEVGRDKVARLAERAGLARTGTLKSAPLSFGIGGGVDVTPLAEAVAYGTFANGGVSVRPRTWTEIRAGGSGTDPGQVVEQGPGLTRVRAVSPAVAADVVAALTDVVDYGTGTAARQPFPVFGKTGTTNGSTDAWFTGCIPDQHLCIATWMGYEDIVCSSASGLRVPSGSCGGMKNLHGVPQVYGGTLPAKIFARSQEILRAIKAARVSGVPLPTPTTSRPTKGPVRVPTAPPVVVATATSRPTVAPTRPPVPTLVPTVPPPTTPPPPIVLPTPP